MANVKKIYSLTSHTPPQIPSANGGHFKVVVSSDCLQTI